MMATRIFFLGLAVLVITSMTSQGAILFEDDFSGSTLDTGKWSAGASNVGTVSVSDGNVTLDVPSGDWTHSQMDSISTWTAASDLYYSFTIGAAPAGNFNIFQVFEGTAQTGYVAMRNDTGVGGWVYDARVGEAGTESYRSTIVQTLDVGDVFTLKIGPSGSAAYKNGREFDNSIVAPLGAMMIDAQCWREPDGVASQTFDYISVSDTAPDPTIPPVEPVYQDIHLDFDGTRLDNPNPMTYQPADGTVYNGILVDSRGGTPADDNLSISASNLLDSQGNATAVNFAVSPVAGEQAPVYAGSDPSSLEALSSDYLYVHATENNSDAPFTISGLGDAETVNIILSPGTYNGQEVVIEGSVNLANAFYDVSVVGGEVSGTIGSGSGLVCVVMGMTIQVNQGLPKPGDANRDGVVNEEDAAMLAQNWLQSTFDGWAGGDFNSDGMVDDIDATLLAANWTTAASASVPEPSMLVLLLAGFAFLVLRKRV